MFFRRGTTTTTQKLRTTNKNHFHEIFFVNLISRKKNKYNFNFWKNLLLKTKNIIQFSILSYY